MAARPGVISTNIHSAKAKVQTQSFTLSPAQILYQSTLQKTLLSELEFLMDVVQGRIADRKSMNDTVKDKLMQGLGTITGMAPIVGSVLGPMVTELGNYLLDKITTKKREDDSRKLLDSFSTLNKQKLEILTTDCAREIACRWEMAINRFVVLLLPLRE